MTRTLVWTAAVAIGFAASAPAQEVADASFYPLKEGSSWTYEVLGSPIVMKAAKTEKIGDQECIRIETVVNDRAVAFEHVAVKEDGVYRYTINGQRPAEPVCFLKFVKAGEKWSVNTTVQGQEVKGDFELKARSNAKVGETSYDKVLVAEGKGFRIAGQETDVSYWFVKDKGIVKLTFSLDGQDVTLELKEYTPAEGDEAGEPEPEPEPETGGDDD